MPLQRSGEVALWGSIARVFFLPAVVSTVTMTVHPDALAAQGAEGHGVLHGQEALRSDPQVHPAQDLVVAAVHGMLETLESTEWLEGVGERRGLIFDDPFPLSHAENLPIPESTSATLAQSIADELEFALIPSERARCRTPSDLADCWAADLDAVFLPSIREYSEGEALVYMYYRTVDRSGADATIERRPRFNLTLKQTNEGWILIDWGIFVI